MMVISYDDGDGDDDGSNPATDHSCHSSCGCRSESEATVRASLDVVRQWEPPAIPTRSGKDFGTDSKTELRWDAPGVPCIPRSQTFANCISACFPVSRVSTFAAQQVLPGDVASLPAWLNSFAVAWLPPASASRGRPFGAVLRGAESGHVCRRRWGYPRSLEVAGGGFE